MAVDAARRRWVAGAVAAASGIAPTRAASLSRRDFRTSDAVRLSLLEAGAAAGKPVVLFVPGWGMPASIWSETLAVVAPAARAVALDPRGQGESDVPDHGYTIERRVADLAELIESLDRVVVVAWSLGVLETLHYVHLHGEQRLAGIVLVDNSVGEPPAPKPSDFLQRLRADRAATMDRFVRGLFTTPQPEARIEEIRRSALRTRLEQSIALLSYPLPREHWRGIARNVRQPLAYWVTPRFAAQAASLKTARPATMTQVFEPAGHALFVDQPAAFHAALSAFLNQVRS